MNILLSMPNDGQSNKYIINALIDCGHEVFFIDHRKDLQTCINAIPTILREKNIDLVLVLYLVPGGTYPADFLKFIKSNFPHVKTAAWIFDTTIGGMYCTENFEFLKIVKEYDYFFTFCNGQIGEYRDKGINAHFCPEGVDRFIPVVDSRMPEYDVCFIGQVGHPNVHQERLELLEKIGENFSLCVFGPLYDGDTIVKHHMLRSTYTDIDHSISVKRAKINLGFAAWPHLDGAFSARAYRVMGAGGFYLTKRGSGIEKIFTEGQHLALYDDIDDCLGKIQYYLKNDTERILIAETGQEKVLKEHTFTKSIKKLLYTVFGDGLMGLR